MYKSLPKGYITVSKGVPRYSKLYKDIQYYYVASVCSQYIASCPDWPIVGHCSPVMPTDFLQASKTKENFHNL